MSWPALPSRGTVLAFDWGEKRIGVAVGELELRSAHPLEVIERRGREQEDGALAALFEQWRPVLAVVGLPTREGEAAPEGEALRTVDGPANSEPHPLAPRCRAFARRLQTRWRIPVRLVDERLSSWAAEDLLKSGDPRRRARREHLDPVAAQQILETFFELIARAARP